MDTITRRAAVIGALASSAAVAMPTAKAVVALDGDPDAALLDLIEQWHEWRDRANNDPVCYGEIEDDPNLAHVFEIEEVIRKTAPHTAQGLAAKLIVVSSYGWGALDDGDERRIVYTDVLDLCPAYIRDGEDGRALRVEIGAAAGLTI